tara:strand:- start:1489 stop:1926 length:438 start_codon:yes stop_codon:yes gene_type:complete
MAIATAMCTSFKKELLEGVHNFTTGGNAFKLALYTTAATLGATTAAYATGLAGQVTSTNYTAGGAALVKTTGFPASSGTTAITDFINLTFSNVTIAARGCLIYNDTNADKAVATIDFGGVKSSTSGDFTVQFPTANATGAIIRIA